MSVCDSDVCVCVCLCVCIFCFVFLLAEFRRTGLTDWKLTSENWEMRPCGCFKMQSQVHICCVLGSWFYVNWFEEYGRRKWDVSLIRARQTLLSPSPTPTPPQKKKRKGKKIQAPGGFEPTTICLLGRRSNHLSYGASWKMKGEFIV